MFSELFNHLGMFGPLILAILSIYLLWNNSNLFFYYIVGIFLNSILNLLLKIIIKEPRPSIDINKFNLALSNYGRNFLFKNVAQYDLFGMPSGHTQSSLFSTIFIYLSLRKTNILYIYLFISFITMVQRVVFNYHTILQVIIGALVGSLFGFYIFYLAREKIQGRITEKIDDFGPI
jgi:membrane-associated phospholipid phosphatase